MPRSPLGAGAGRRAPSWTRARCGPGASATPGGRSTLRAGAVGAAGSGGTALRQDGSFPQQSAPAQDHAPLHDRPGRLGRSHGTGRSAPGQTGRSRRPTRRAGPPRGYWPAARKDADVTPGGGPTRPRAPGSATGRLWSRRGPSACRARSGRVRDARHQRRRRGAAGATAHTSPRTPRRLAPGPGEPCPDGADRVRAGGCAGARAGGPVRAGVEPGEVFSRLIGSARPRLRSAPPARQVGRCCRPSCPACRGTGVGPGSWSPPSRAGGPVLPSPLPLREPGPSGRRPVALSGEAVPRPHGPVRTAAPAPSGRTPSPGLWRSAVRGYGAGRPRTGLGTCGQAAACAALCEPRPGARIGGAARPR